MNSITIFIGKALICFAGQCHPALVGPDTPPGTYNLTLRHVVAPGYGGVVLQFKETEKTVYAIHRPYALDKKVDRKQALKSDKPEFRRLITKGCVNVDDSVFDSLMTGKYKVVNIYP